jgi:hypothetical protein
MRGGTDRRPVEVNKSANSSSGNSTWHSRCSTAQIESSFTRSPTKLVVPFIRSACRGANPSVTATPPRRTTCM